MEKDSLSDSLYENRLLVFLEDNECGVFNQILLNPAQFRKVSEDICTEKWKDGNLRDGYEMVEVNKNDDRDIPADTFIGMESVYSETD